VGKQQYISGATPLRYGIYFGNEPTATAPVQVATITDSLPATIDDLTTFSFGPIAFGNQIVFPGAGASYSTTVDLRPQSNLLVGINAIMNPDTGQVSWKFTSLDPSTGHPTTDPTAGFLPPGGNGSVFFTVMPKQGLSTGTQFQNQATVVFDVNAPIKTPTWFNALDNTPPMSHVSLLAVRESSSCFRTQWIGSDLGAGVRSYTIFVSDNGELYTAWLSATTESSDIFKGQPGHSYAFYSQATDRVGNVESGKTVADSTTTVAPKASCDLSSVPPATPITSLPIDGSTAVDLVPTLAWDAAGGATSYDIYFGTSSSPPLVTNTSATTFSPGTLAAATKYYWRVVAKDGGGSATSRTESFTTMNAQQSPPQVIPWFADGGGVRTTFVLVNKSSKATPISMKFHDPNGTAYPLSILGRGPISTYSSTLQGGGILYLETDGNSACQNSSEQKPNCQNNGWVELSAPTSVSGYVVFHLAPNGTFGASDVAVQASSLGTTMYLPFDRRVLSDASLNVIHKYDTSLALVNPDPSQTATVNFSFTDESGSNTGSATRTVPPQGVKGYSLSTEFASLTDGRGTMTITSTIPLTGFGLRFDAVPYLILTSLPLIPANSTPPSGTSTQIIPWFADGGGLTSTLALANSGTETANYTANFFDLSGNPYSLSLAGTGPVSSDSGTLSPGTIAFLDTDGNSPCQDSTKQQPKCQNNGWVQVQTTGNMAGYAVYHLEPNSSWGASDVAVQGSQPSKILYLPYDRRVLQDASQTVVHRYDTSMALVNTEPFAAASVTFSLADESGKLLGTVQDTVPANGVKGYSFKDVFPFDASIRGLVTITSTTPLTGFGLRFDYKPYLIFTSLPFME
jgi:hypothetical protein